MNPEEIRELWVRWYALPDWARHGLGAFTVALAALLYVVAVGFACYIAHLLFGDVGVIATLIVGIAGFAGLVVATISALDVPDAKARQQRERRTGAKP